MGPRGHRMSHLPRGSLLGESPPGPQTAHVCPGQGLSGWPPGTTRAGPTPSLPFARLILFSNPQKPLGLPLS